MTINALSTLLRGRYSTLNTKPPGDDFQLRCRKVGLDPLAHARLVAGADGDAVDACVEAMKQLDEHHLLVMQQLQHDPRTMLSESKRLGALIPSRVDG